MAMTNFRRSAISNSASKPRGSGGGGGGGWFDMFKLPVNTPTPFVLIKAEYIDPNPPQERIEYDANNQPIPVKNLFYKYKQHTRKTFKNGQEYFPKERCSTGHDPHNPQPCAGCMAYDMGDKTISLSDRFAFGIVHLTPYHRHPMVDYQTGQVRMKQDNSGPFFKYSECLGRSCSLCKYKAGQPLPKGETPPPFHPNDISTEFGHRRYLDLGKNHLNNLQSWDGTITSQCSSPIYDAKGTFIAKCGQQLTRMSFNCPHCDSVLIDMATDPRTDEEIEQAIAHPYVCLKCQKSVNVHEVVSCDSCASAQRPHLQNGIVDMVLWGMRQGEGTQSQLVLQQFQLVEEFQRSLPGPIQQMLGGKSVADIIKELGNPYNFDEVIKTNTVADQAKRLMLQGIPTGGQVGNQSAYSAPMGQQAAPYVPQQPYAQQVEQAPPFAPYAPMAPNFGKK